MIGVGVDAVDVERFRAVLSRTPSVIGRVFTPGERAYAEQAADPIPHFAVRYAAKEAAMKALGVGLGSFGFHDVEVVRAPWGTPTLEITGRAAERAAEQGVTRWHLSLTHTKLSAVAVVIAE